MAIKGTGSLVTFAVRQIAIAWHRRQESCVQSTGVLRISEAFGLLSASYDIGRITAEPHTIFLSANLQNEHWKLCLAKNSAAASGDNLSGIGNLAYAWLRCTVGVLSSI